MNPALVVLVLLPLLSLCQSWDVAYNPHLVRLYAKNRFDILMKMSNNGKDLDPQGSRISTRQAYSRGTIRATIASGAFLPGLVSCFYLSDHDPPNQDEIDLEFMGRDGHSKVQTNYFIDGQWSLAQEKFHRHDHTIQSNYVIKFDVRSGAQIFINGKKVRDIKFSRPMNPLKIYCKLILEQL